MKKTSDYLVNDIPEKLTAERAREFTSIYTKEFIDLYKALDAIEESAKSGRNYIKLYNILPSTEFELARLGYKVNISTEENMAIKFLADRVLERTTNVSWE